MLAEEYFLLTLPKKGQYSMGNYRLAMGLVAAGLSDLCFHEVITLENKKLVIMQDLPEELQALNPLYTAIKNLKKASVKKLTEYYASTLSNKRLHVLESAIGKSLVEKRLIEQDTKDRYSVNSVQRKQVIQMIRQEIDSQDISNETMVLLSLLEASKQLKQYFSKVEMVEMKQLIKELRKQPERQVWAQMIKEIDTTIIIISSISVY
ncbi:GPP34 family phosphoprotein [Enterococcus saccharolyticus]|uniref:GPP34 family phosphoprotein n=1 Tax=Candidatus Enterococcus willemsii TaxID=1857215 RepID=A0ABQ6Z272_9ENTE|nr:MULTISPECIES: GPP34 family phosphoprotein [Enterococcus]KAF1305523.1 hypothetical protein BAU17_07490 [Enterococcus sp. CU12B]MCD5002719.1 GPP34 family phosphoprotein [Enterococcus saccharolyticus]